MSHAQNLLGRRPFDPRNYGRSSHPISQNPRIETKAQYKGLGDVIPWVGPYQAPSAGKRGTYTTWVATVRSSSFVISLRDDLDRPTTDDQYKCYEVVGHYYDDEHQLLGGCIANFLNTEEGRASAFRFAEALMRLHDRELHDFDFPGYPRG